MAAANPTPPDHGEDNFVLELGRVREQIKEKFFELIYCVKARECKLLEELDTILASYHSYRDEVQKQNNDKKTLEESKILLEEELRKSSVKGSHEKSIKHEFKSIEFPAEPKIVYFVCDNNIMFAELNKLGKLLEKVGSDVNYYEKAIHPVVSVCEIGNGMEQLHHPWGVTVDNKTGNIYVADSDNHCVKVFDSSGKILFKFGDSHGKGKMLFPRDLVIIEDRILISIANMLSKSNHSILIYHLNGKFVSKIGKYGNGQIEFIGPYGITWNKWNGDIYICDRYNNRIQILTKEFQFKSQFGADKLKHPRDVKLSIEYIFILDESNPCMHLYDYNLILQKNVISRGEGMQVVTTFCFSINDSNILISDCNSNSIQIFNPKFELIHKINTSTYPMGVVVDNQRRVLVVCQADRNCLQIF